MPDGATVAVTTGDWMTRDFITGNSIRSTGGTIVDGSTSPSGSAWKFYKVQNGSVTVTYSPQGATVGTARIQMVPAKPDGTTLDSWVMVGGVWPITITN